MPSNWAVCRLEDIAVIGTGATPDTRIDAYYNGNIPWINSSCTKGEYIDTPSSFISEKAISETNCQIYPSGSLVMAMYGEGKTRGQVSELCFDSATNQACAAIVPIDNQMKVFMKAYLKSNYYHIRTLAEGGNQPNLNLSKISHYIIPIPPIEEQARIVAAIDKWFALIDKLETAKDALQTSIAQAKSKILDLAIHGKLVPQDPNDEPAIELLKRINPKFIPCDNAHYGSVPDGWVLCRLEDIVEYEQPQDYIVQSTEYSPQYKTPVLTAGKSFIIGYTNETKGVFKDVPVIIFDDFTTDSKFVDFPFKVKSSAMKILRVKDGINIQYVCQFMSITRLIGDTHKRYWISEYSKIPIPVPPRAEQDRIINKVNELFQILDCISAEL